MKLTNEQKERFYTVVNIIVSLATEYGCYSFDDLMSCDKFKREYDKKGYALIKKLWEAKTFDPSALDYCIRLNRSLQDEFGFNPADTLIK